MTSINNYMRIFLISISLLFSLILAQDQSSAPPMAFGLLPLQECNETCGSCISYSFCTTCANQQLKLNTQAGTCDFCPVGQFLKENQCQGCSFASCQQFSDTSTCVDEETCIKCDPDSSTPYLDLDILQCVNSCNEPGGPLKHAVTVNNHTYLNGAFKYCRAGTIYVDPDSNKYMELGTLSYPYKSSQMALIELFNYLPTQQNNFNILIKEGTVDLMVVLQQIQYIVDAQNLTISTYKAENPSIKGGQATLEFHYLDSFQINPSTRFSVIQNETYNLSSKIEAGKITPSELLLIGTEQLVLVIRSNVTFDNLIIQNERYQKAQQYYFMQAWDIQLETIQFTNVIFNIYGRVFESITPLNLYIIDTIMLTDYLTQGILVQTDCSLVPNSVTYGDIFLSNFTLRGTRNLMLQYPMIFIATQNNITLQNSLFTSYAQRFDQGISQVYLGGSQLCNVNSFDGRTKKVVFNNNTIMGVTSFPYTIYMFKIYANQYSDTVRPLQVEINSNRIMNIYSIYGVLDIQTTAQQLTISNLHLSNVSTSAEDVAVVSISAPGTLYLKDVSFTNSITKMAFGFLIKSGVLLDIDGMKFRTVILDVDLSSQVFFKYVPLSVEAKCILNNLNFSQNKIYKNQITVVDPPYNNLRLSNSIFQNETLASDSIYLEFRQVNVLYLSNVTFNNLTYSDTLQQGSYAIKIRKIYIYSYQTDNSSFSNVSFTNSKVNFLNFGGFKDNGQQLGQQNLLEMFNINIQNNSLPSNQVLVLINDYILNANATIQITNSSIFNNVFASRGYLIQILANQLQSIRFTNVEISNNILGLIIIAAGDKLNSSLPLRVRMKNMTMWHNQPLAQALMTIQQNSKLYVIDSVFFDTQSLSRGSIFFADYQNAYLYVNGSTFFLNYGYLGGIFYTHYSSFVEIENSIVQTNVGVQGAIGMAVDNGYFRIHNSSLTANYAFKASLCIIISAADKTTIFSNSTFTQNNILTFDLFKLVAFFFNPQFVTKIYADEQNIRKITQNSRINHVSISLGNLQIVNQSIVIQQTNFIYSYGGKLNIQNLIMNNMAYEVGDQSIISLTQSDAIIVNLTCTTVYYKSPLVSTDQYLLSINLNSNLSLINSSLSLFSVSLINSLDSILHIEGMSISNVSIPASYPLMQLQSSEIKFKDIYLKNITVKYNQIITIKICDDVRIQNLNVLKTYQDLILAQKSTIRMRNSTFRQNQLDQQSLNSSTSNRRAIYASESTIYIYWSSFYFLQSGGYGGAIYCFNSDLHVANNVFQNNIAQVGGAISMQCLQNTQCNVDISNTSFDSNAALMMGGALSYDKYKPQLTNVTYGPNNYAKYGSNIAGYPYTIKVTSYTKYSLISGQKYQGSIYVDILDADQNLVTTDDVYQVKIQAQASEISTIGEVQVATSKGEAVLNNFQFLATPGSSNVPFVISSPSILNANIIKYFGLDESATINQEIIYFDFRNCIRGEFVEDRACMECEGGTYSLKNNSQECLQCPLHAFCPGKDIIVVNNGYWRSSIDSINIIECQSESACIGGSSPPYVENEGILDYPICATGHGGNLCAECQNVDGIQYGKVGYDCKVCPSKASNSIKIGGVFLALLVGIGLIILSNLRTTKNNDISVILRIITNYFQVLNTVANLNLQWPSQLTKFFSVIQFIGAAQDQIISFDCFLIDTVFGTNNSSLFYFKAIVIAIFPIVTVIVFLIIFGIWKWIRKISWARYKKLVIVSVVSIIYVAYPTILKYGFALFFCMELDPGQTWLQQDLQVECWTSDHLKWAIAIGLPIILLWVIGTPVVALVKLFKNRKNLDEKEFFSKYRMMYQGLRPECFYWEFVNLLRKVFLVIVNVFLSIKTDIFKAMVSLAGLAFCYRFQQQIRPYSSPMINELESREYLSMMVTFFGSLFFVNTIISSQIQIAVFVLIILFNSWFLLLCAYCLLRQFNFRLINKIVLFLGMVAITQDLKRKETTWISNMSGTGTKLGSKSDKQSYLDDDDDDAKNKTSLVNSQNTQIAQNDHASQTNLLNLTKNALFSNRQTLKGGSVPSSNTIMAKLKKQDSRFGQQIHTNKRTTKSKLVNIDLKSSAAIDSSVRINEESISSLKFDAQHRLFNLREENKEETSTPNMAKESPSKQIMTNTNGDQTLVRNFSQSNISSSVDFNEKSDLVFDEHSRLQIMKAIKQRLPPLTPQQVITSNSLKKKESIFDNTNYEREDETKNGDKAKDFTAFTVKQRQGRKRGEKSGRRIQKFSSDLIVKDIDGNDEF